jgi:hypothetical protein
VVGCIVDLVGLWVLYIAPLLVFWKKMSTYYSKSDASFNMAIADISLNNQCYDAINQQIFSNPGYYTVDSCNNLILTASGNELYQNLILNKPVECAGIKPSEMNQTDIIQRYQTMVRRRREIDQNLNMILNENNPDNLQTPMFQQTNRDYSVSIMFVVLAISMVYYTVRHLRE